MIYKRLFSLTALLTATMVTISAQEVSGGAKGLFRGDRNKTIEELQRRLDSLQRAYDSLYVDYQTVVEPINVNDTEDIVETQAIEYTAQDIDSLLNTYYMQNSLDVNDFDLIAIDRDTLTSNIPDSVYIARLNKLNSFIPIQFNRYVKNSIIRYTDRIPGATQKIISLAPYYLPQFEEIFDEFGIPTELKAMAVIESALNPRAVSRAKAKGMWQFIYTTARRYDLNINSFVDERFDPIASCRAAAQYLKDSYLVFGDWSLAIASYNCGLGNVRKAITRSGGKTDFWEIYDYLPRETRGYIPAFIAALYVLEYYPEHGITPKPVALPAAVDTFHINKMLHFQQISENIDIPIDIVRDLNPQYFKDIIPGTEREYILRLPFNYSNAFAEKEEQIYAYKDSIFFNEVAIQKVKESEPAENGGRIIHKVKRGETLNGLAVKYHTTISNIKRWNGLRSNTIQVGQRLAIYSGGSAPKSPSYGTAPSPSKPASSGGYVYYKVKEGDTLSSIAKRHGVSLSSVLKLNNLTTKSKIYPGMKIRVKKAA